ncbi:MAG: protease HtpX [Bdellovibrionales bacterium]|nr:protease HtpX [Bdellovibrionales bacterium]
MAIAKRLFLFMLLNFLVMLTIVTLTNLLGLRPYLNANGLDLGQLAAFCLIWGMAGSFISLQLSRWMAKRAMGVQVIDANVRDPQLQELVQTVQDLSRSAGLPKMPEVGIYESPEPNAFATGPSKSRSLVAVSTGLLRNMNRDQVAGVLAHEVAHIANGDMVTMTLVQGVVNAFVMFLARIAAYAVAQALRGRDERDSGMSGFAFHGLVFVFDILFMFVGMIVVAWFSRQREYRADAGAAKLGGRDRMIAALEGLRRMQQVVDPHANPPALQTMKISGHPTGLARFFSTHPPLEKRIERLQEGVGAFSA